MADATNAHTNRPVRHTAKSDQRFDADRRIIINTSNAANERQEFKTEKETEKKKQEKDEKNERDMSKNERNISKINRDTSENEHDMRKNERDTYRNERDTYNNGLYPTDEIKILKHWGLLKKTLNVGSIIDPLIEKGVVTPERWMELKRNNDTDQDCVEEFLYLLLKCQHTAYDIFLKVLKSRGYGHLANQLEGVHSNELSPQISVSSEGSNQSSRQIGRPPAASKIFPRQGIPVVISDPRNGAAAPDKNVNVSSALPEHGPVSMTTNTRQNTVKPEDLHRMKEEITVELRELRANIEKDRDEDRLELRILQRKHTELKDDLTKTKGDKEQLKTELTFVKETVKVLKAQIDLKQAEYDQVKERNHDLEKQLERRSGHLERLIKEKEKEKNELMKTLQTKEAEYKQLQNMLERLKEEHEDRHARLKGLTKDKVTLEKEVQLLNKEKKNLEVKIKSLEQHIRSLQEKHFRETGDIKEELVKQKTLLDEKEKERLDLEKKLQESVLENEKLKKTNLDLVENLQKTKEEKAHLQQKLHKADMTKYALPPFLAGSKSSRTGWNPKNLRR